MYGQQEKGDEDVSEGAKGVQGEGVRTKADVIKPLHMNDVWTILVGDQFYNFQNRSFEWSTIEYVEKQTSKIFGKNNFSTICLF